MSHCQNTQIIAFVKISNPRLANVKQIQYIIIPDSQNVRKKRIMYVKLP